MDRLEQIQDKYLGQTIGEFLHDGGDPAEYARLVFAREIFGPSEDPRDPELDIETEGDLVEALELLAAQHARLAALERSRAGTQFQSLSPGEATVTVQVRMPAGLVARADARAIELGVTRSELIRAALEEIIAR